MQGAIPLWAGVLITALDAFLLLLIERFGVRNLEALFGVLIAVMAGSFGIMCSLAGVRALDVAEGDSSLSSELSCVCWSMLVCVTMCQQDWHSIVSRMHGCNLVRCGFSQLPMHCPDV